MSPSNQRARRHQRLDPPPAMRLTERDVQIIDAVYRYRVLSQTQIRRLLFDGLNPNAANRRLYSLYHNAYLERRFLLNQGGVMTSEILYVLDRVGRDTLLQQGLYEDIKWSKHLHQSSSQHLEHLLHSNTFRIEVVLAVSRSGIALHTWLDDTALHQDYDRVFIKGGRETESIIPDGYFCLRMDENRAMHFFFEMDNDKMSIPRFQRKIKKYHAWSNSGKLFARFQTNNYRVLTVTTSERRMHALREATKRAGGKNRFWFSVLDETTADRVLTQPVWWLPERDQPAQLVNL